MKNKVVTAEIPQSDKYLHLYEKVANFMMHSPCGHHNLQAPCMENG